MNKNQICYLFNKDLPKYQFSHLHPMKPRRIGMTHDLVKKLNLASSLTIYQSKQATSEQLAAYHDTNYVSYLQTWITPNLKNVSNQISIDIQLEQVMEKDKQLNQIFNINQTVDCPGFQGLDKFCKLAAGASLDAADLIIQGYDTVVNWSGGYHHAKQGQASGFCYINDIVLCILQLLKVYDKVLYLDIDVHHGDGVQQAFYQTNRVMVVSFHQYEPKFFPQSGSISNIGNRAGKYYSVNVPLKKGIDDHMYLSIFRSIMSRVCAFYNPKVIVVQCGADSLSKDYLGDFNLSIKGHANCLEYMKSFGVPVIYLGGGGYTISNVARCWAYETAMMVGKDIQNQIPEQAQFYYQYLNENYKIHFQTEKKMNMNTIDQMHDIIQTITQNLRDAQNRPSIGFHYAPGPRGVEVIQIQDSEDEV